MEDNKGEKAICKEERKIRDVNKCEHNLKMNRRVNVE